MYALELLMEDGEATGPLHPLAPQPIYLGRAPNNDIVVLDKTVSGRHLAAWVRLGRIWVEDLQSRNGTYVDEQRVQGAVRVNPGQVVRVGEGTRLRIREAQPVAGSTPAIGGLQVEDVEAGVRYPLRTDRFRIGAGSDVDLLVEGAPPVAATLMVHEDGETWLGEGDSAREIAVDQAFGVAGRTFALRAVRLSISVTREVAATRYPYALKASLDAPGGPLAEVVDEHTGVRHAVTGETRAVLLYLLARQRREDLAQGLNAEEAGWADDREVMVGIWGREGNDAPASKLNTLICRVRQELREAGFDPWFVEKRRGAIRARVRKVALDVP